MRIKFSGVHADWERCFLGQQYERSPTLGSVSHEGAIRSFSFVVPFSHFPILFGVSIVFFFSTFLYSAIIVRLQLKPLQHQYFTLLLFSSILFPFSVFSKTFLQSDGYQSHSARISILAHLAHPLRIWPISKYRESGYDTRFPTYVWCFSFSLF